MPSEAELIAIPEWNRAMPEKGIARLMKEFHMRPRACLTGTSEESHMDDRKRGASMSDTDATTFKRGQLPPRNPRGHKWSVMAGLTPPLPPQGAPGFEGASDISDTGDYFINGDYGKD